jgi:hypothetical protein
MEIFPKTEFCRAGLRPRAAKASGGGAGNVDVGTAACLAGLRHEDFSWTLPQQACAQCETPPPVPDQPRRCNGKGNDDPHGCDVTEVLVVSHDRRGMSGALVV